MEQVTCEDTVHAVEKIVQEYPLHNDGSAQMYDTPLKEASHCPKPRKDLLIPTPSKVVAKMVMPPRTRSMKRRNASHEWEHVAASPLFP